VHVSILPVLSFERFHHGGNEAISGQEAEFHDIICGFVIGGRGEISEGGRSMLSGKQGELSLVLLTCQFRYRKEPAYLDYDVKLYLSAS
jgi:hypothetical protein